MIPARYPDPKGKLPLYFRLNCTPTALALKGIHPLYFYRKEDTRCPGPEGFQPAISQGSVYYLTEKNRSISLPATLTLKGSRPRDS